MRKLFKTFFSDDSGAAAVEYGLLVGAVAALMVVIVFAIGDGVKSGFLTVCNAMAQNAGMAACE